MMDDAVTNNYGTVAGCGGVLWDHIYNFVFFMVIHAT